MIKRVVQGCCWHVKCVAWNSACEIFGGWISGRMRVGMNEPGGVSRDQTIQGLQAGWWVVLELEAVGSPGRVGSSRGVERAAWSSSPDDVPAPGGLFLWPRGARHAPELLSVPRSHAKSINNPTAKPNCSFLTLSGLTSPELQAGEYTQLLQNHWLWFVTETLQRARPRPPATEPTAWVASLISQDTSNFSFLW